MPETGVNPEEVLREAFRVLLRFLDDLPRSLGHHEVCAAPPRIPVSIPEHGTKPAPTLRASASIPACDWREFGAGEL